MIPKIIVVSKYRKIVCKYVKLLAGRLYNLEVYKSMEEQIPRHNGTEMVRRLTIKMVESLSSSLCTICQIEFIVRDTVAGLECGHGFHKDCFLNWVQTVILIE